MVPGACSRKNYAVAAVWSLDLAPSSSALCRRAPGRMPRSTRPACAATWPGGVDRRTARSRLGKQPSNATPGIAARRCAAAVTVEIRQADRAKPADEPHAPEQFQHPMDGDSRGGVAPRFRASSALRYLAPGLAAGVATVALALRAAPRSPAVGAIADALRRLDAPARSTRRFRPNLLVDLPDAPGDFPCRNGRTGLPTVGAARLRVVEPCRCWWPVTNATATAARPRRVACAGGQQRRSVRSAHAGCAAGRCGSWRSTRVGRKRSPGRSPPGFLQIRRYPGGSTILARSSRCLGAARAEKARRRSAFLVVLAAFTCLASGDVRVVQIRRSGGC